MSTTDDSTNKANVAVAAVSGSDQAVKPSCPNWEDHDWKETYYGDQCEKCGLFFAHGCAPWDEMGDDDRCDWCDGYYSHFRGCPMYEDDDPYEA